MDKVVQLCDYSGNSLTNKQVADWMRAWADVIERQPLGIRTLIVTAESEHGGLHSITTGIAQDRARVMGIMHAALAAKTAGNEHEVFYGAG